jgi:Xaa-Pro aminopeptidase
MSHKETSAKDLARPATPPVTRTPSAELEDRRNRLRRLMASEHLDLLVCYGDAWRTANIRYFTDFRPVDGINGIEQAVLLFPLSGEPHLFVGDGCFDAAQETTSFPVSTLAELASVAARRRGRWSSAAVAGLSQMPGPVRAALRAIFNDEMTETDLLARTKAVKSAWEVDQLRHAAALTDAGMARLQEIITAGEPMSERDLAREADIAMIRAGADGVAFLSMVQSGPRSSYSLALPSARIVRPGDLVLTDIGARYGNYVADGGRGFTVGDVSDEVMDIVDTSVSAVEAGLAFARPGITASALNREIQSVLVERGYAGHSVEARGRGTGHGTGMDPEEEHPWIGPTNDDVLLPGMVFTLKATINVPGVGGLRTERLVHLIEGGVAQLDSFPMRNHW